MSIARNEAERIWQPSQAYDKQYDRDTRIKAYVRGRTAELCDEQVEAVARVLAVANAYYSDSGFYHLDGIKRALNENEDFWSYKTVEDVSDLMEVARMVLEAARKAVM